MTVRGRPSANSGAAHHVGTAAREAVAGTISVAHRRAAAAGDAAKGRSETPSWARSAPAPGIVTSPSCGLLAMAGRIAPTGDVTIPGRVLTAAHDGGFRPALPPHRQPLRRP